MSSAPSRRPRAPIPEGPFDLAVIGGGINGVSIARDAALRGKSVILLEKDDFASGTSSASSKMIHGGIRYLEQLRIGLVYEALRERAALLRTAPHLVTPQSFILPVYEHGRRKPAWIRLGLWLYDALCYGRRLGKTRFYDPEHVAGAVPGIEGDALLGGGLYFDAVMDDARLALANVLSARDESPPARFRAFNYVRVVDLAREESHGCRLTVRDETNQSGYDVYARRVVRALGPWSPEDLLVRSKGVHLVLPKMTGQHGLLLEHSKDGRVFFVIPWKEFTLVGTTETPFDGSADSLEVTPEEVDYLIGEVGRVLPGQKIRRDQILGTFAGIRPLAKRSGFLAKTFGRLFGAGAGSTSRTHRIVRESDDVWSVVGGKYTTYRAVAEEVVDKLFPDSACRTADVPLAGGDEGGREALLRKLEEHARSGVSDAELERLYRRHGSRLRRILERYARDPALAEPILDGAEITRAEIIHAVESEFAVYASDVLDRRTSLRYSTVDKTELYDRVAEVVAEHRAFCVEGEDEDRERWIAERDHEASLRAEAGSATA